MRKLLGKRSKRSKAVMGETFGIDESAKEMELGRSSIWNFRGGVGGTGPLTEGRCC